MGIYPDIDFKRDRENNTVVWTYKEPGFTVTETYKLVERKEDRTDCFCCSCSDMGNDMACRNHGNGLVGERPCDYHKMPGSVDDNGVMPASVQEWRRTHHD